MSKELHERCLDIIDERKRNIESGNINCIPFPFKRFRDDLPGIEQGRYYIVTGATKSGKTQFASYLFVYYPILYSFKHRDKLKVKIFYYAQEETPEQVMIKFMSYALFILSQKRYRVSPTNLLSTSSDKPLEQVFRDEFNKDIYKKLLKHFNDCVEFCENGSPESVRSKCVKYANAHGKSHMKPSSEEGFEDEQELDWYEPNDPREYRIIFYDHVSLVPVKGQSLRETMTELSKTFVELRNSYRYIIASIQQQAMFENLDAFKMEMLKPSIQNLADNKAVARDCDCCISMFSPYKYGLASYSLGQDTYDIRVLKDNIRFMECLLNRHGISNGMLALQFDGACNYFAEMPRPSDITEYKKVLDYVNKIRTDTTGVLFLNIKINKKNNGKD